jgi:hypothetical protein
MTKKKQEQRIYLASAKIGNALSRCDPRTVHCHILKAGSQTSSLKNADSVDFGPAPFLL